MTPSATVTVTVTVTVAVTVIVGLTPHFAFCLLKIAYILIRLCHHFFCLADLIYVACAFQARCPLAS